MHDTNLVRARSWSCTAVLAQGAHKQRQAGSVPCTTGVKRCAPRRRAAQMRSAAAAGACVTACRCRAQQLHGGTAALRGRTGACAAQQHSQVRSRAAFSEQRGSAV
jgi:hypothetical protein